NRARGHRGCPAGAARRARRRARFRAPTRTGRAIREAARAELARAAGAAMMFVLRMAARETRASWRRLLFFFVCIAVGVAAIVALRSVIQSVREGVNTEARALVGADVVLGTNRDWPEATRQRIDHQLATFGAFAQTETTETPTMVRPADTSKTVTKMAELRAIQPGYPLYGAISLQNGKAYSHALVENHGALVRPELLTALQLNTGDQIAIGVTTFTIRGVI